MRAWWAGQGKIFGEILWFTEYSQHVISALAGIFGKLRDDGKLPSVPELKV